MSNVKKVGCKEGEQGKQGDESKQTELVKCRSRRLVKLLSGFNEAQKEAIRRIGFGGLLDLNFSRFPHQYVSMFLQAFNDGTHIFRASKHKEFLVSKHDVHDCFLLPVGPKQLELIPTGRMTLKMEESGVAEEYRKLKEQWRSKFDVPNSSMSISLGKLFDHMKRDKEGGDDFCRNFVIFSMSSFLCPTSNNGVDIKLVKAVDNVRDISQYDWCSYVLQGLVTAALDYKDDPTCVLGCIPFLMITYFQRFDFRGEICPHDLPLIKHWDEGKILARIKGELLSGALGRQSWSVVKYPRCVQDTPSVNVNTDTPLKIGYSDFEATTVRSVVPFPKCSGQTKFIQIELPVGVEDDDELKAKALDVSNFF